MISVVIPAYNEEERIGICLDALVNQETDEPYEVIVVDHDSTDRTRAIAESYAGTLDIRVLNETIPGRGAGRALGFRMARGDVILSADADTIVSRDWLAVFASAARDPRYVAATGTARIRDCSWWTNTVFNFCLPLLLQCNRLLYGHVGLSGYAFSIRRDVYQKAGGFDPQADAYEDLELGMRVSKLGRIKLILHPRVLFSGRRFKNGLVTGGREYLKTWYDRFIKKKRHVHLSNVK